MDKMKNIMQEMPEGKAKSQLTNELLKVQGVRRFQLVNELANITMNAYKTFKFAENNKENDHDTEK